jgi:hypothetical protein
MMIAASDYRFEIRAAAWVSISGFFGHESITYAVSLEQAQAAADRMHKPGWSVAIWDDRANKCVEYRAVTF